MAGLFDSFAKDPNTDPEVVRKALEAQQRANLGEWVKGAKTQKETGARDIIAGIRGLADSGLFGESFKQPEDPRLAAVKKDAELAAEINGLGVDLSSAAGAAKAAEVAAKYGRDDLAVHYKEVAGARATAEASSAAAVQKAATTEARNQFTALPTAAQEELVARQPEFLMTTLGLDPEDAQAISDKVAERNAFQQAKLKKQLEDVGSVTTTKTSTADVEQVKSTLHMMGIDSSSFGWTKDEEALGAFATPLAAEVQRRMDVLKDSGARGDRNKITADVVKELEESGAFKMEPQFLDGSRVNLQDFNSTKFKEVFTGSSADLIDLSE